MSVNSEDDFAEMTPGFAFPPSDTELGFQPHERSRISQNTATLASNPLFPYLNTSIDSCRSQRAWSPEVKHAFVASSLWVRGQEAFRPSSWQTTPRCTLDADENWSAWGDSSRSSS